jgi:hypothetical protein
MSGRLNHEVESSGLIKDHRQWASLTIVVRAIDQRAREGGAGRLKLLDSQGRNAIEHFAAGGRLDM